MKTTDKLPGSDYSFQDTVLAAEMWEAAFEIMYDVSKNDMRLLKRLRADIIENFVWDIIDKRIQELEKAASQNENPTKSSEYDTD